jgi:hypothetical protein
MFQSNFKRLRRKLKLEMTKIYAEGKENEQLEPLDKKSNPKPKLDALELNETLWKELNEKNGRSRRGKGEIRIKQET